MQAIAHCVIDVGVMHGPYRGAHCFLAFMLLLGVSGRVSGQAAADAVSNSAAGRPSDTAVSDQPAQTSPKPRPIRIVPFGPPATLPTTKRKPIGGSSNNGTVQYWGGPVISNVQVVEVLWGNFVDVPSTTGLEQFFTDVTQSNYFGLLAEYSTVGLTGLGGAAGTNQIIGPGSFLNPRITIAPSLCPGSAANPSCTITDAQIETEIANQLNAGKLPTPVQDNQGNFNTIYMVYFPPGVTIILAPGVNSCQQHGFCAYHSNVALNLQPKLPYAVFPDFGPTGGCSAALRGCGAGTSQQNLSSASSHELGEAVTDVEVGSFNGNVLGPPLAWFDQNSGEEIGDFCNHSSAQITVNSNTYTVQNLFSNLQQACVSAPGHFDFFSQIKGAVPGVPFQVTVSAASSVFDQGLNGYNNTVHFTSSDGAAVLPPDYTFVPGDNGSHSFNVTLNTTGNQTVTVNDTVVIAMTGSFPMDIEHNPDLTATSSHNGSFKEGDIGDTYTITASNVGDLPTNGSTVSVFIGLSGTLPFGLTATAISGSGWSCVLASLTCTTTATVAAHTSYPAITLTVNVANNAPASLTLFGAVSGGGELNTSNDSFSDPTTVIQIPDLAVAKTHVGTFAQGQLGETYTITVSNVGFAPTSGQVTVTDQLPAGLTATAISGAGWTCSTPPTLTCTRADALNPLNAAYPPITLTVNVDANAPMPSVTNTASVSGGGEVNATNDGASDVTTITVAASDLIVASSHNGNFTQGQIGAVYTLTVSNIGPAATSGTVTVRDTLPIGLTARGLTGNGWNCDLGSLTCTRSDALAGNTTGTVSSYPPIALSVDVAVNASTPLTNLVAAFGGGELNTANDGSSDPTVVIQFPNLQIVKNHFGSFAQGQTGATYNLEVENIVGVPTIGTVTVTDNLPAGLTATSIVGPGWNCTLANLTCTRNDPLSVGNYPTIVLTVNVAANAPSSVTNIATVSGGGEIITGDDSASDPTTITPPISLPSNLGSVNIAAGGSVTFSFAVSSNLPGVVTLACSGVPPGAACVFSPSSTPQGTIPVNLTINTTGPLASTLSSQRAKVLPPGFYLLAAFGLATIIVARRSRGTNWLRQAIAVTAAAAFLFLAGCGGGTTQPPPPPPRVVTPPGTYTITVTATNTTTTTATASTTATITVH